MPAPKGELSTNFSLHAAGLLSPAGHNQLLVIADMSLAIDPDSQEFYHAGTEDGDRTAAAALTELAAAYPLEPRVGYYMLPEGTTPGELKGVKGSIPGRNQRALTALRIRAVGLLADGEYDQQESSYMDGGPMGTGFYDLIWHRHDSLPPTPAIVCRTFSQYAFDCIAVLLGHSQNKRSR